jgi:hypothetical protein
VPNANGVSSRLLRAGSPGVTVTLTSSTPTVGDLVSGSTTAASVTATIPAGSNLSSNVLFHPIAAGQTTVSITAPGVITTPLGSATVTVTTPTISLSSDLPATVGAGLQTSNRRAFLGASNHGGVVMRIESSNPAIALVAPNGSTAGTAFILVNVPNGQTQVNFVVQGVEGADGGVVITASTPGFSDAQNTATVVPAALAFNGLSATATAGGADDGSVVLAGIPDATGSALAQIQTVRGGGQMNVTITSSSPAVAGLVSGASTVPSLTMTIGANQQQTANVSLRPLTGGSTLVTATAPNGVITTTQAAVTVTVNP